MKLEQILIAKDLELQDVKNLSATEANVSSIVDELLQEIAVCPWISCYLKNLAGLGVNSVCFFKSYVLVLYFIESSRGDPGERKSSGKAQSQDE